MLKNIEEVRKIWGEIDESSDINNTFVPPSEMEAGKFKCSTCSFSRGEQS